MKFVSVEPNSVRSSRIGIQLDRNIGFHLITGDLINYVSHISVNGCDFCITMEDGIIWVHIDSENTLLEIFYPSDINNDGDWNILDILLTINFIMGEIEPTPEQNFLADMNQDGSIDILDIIMMVNFVLNQ